jgi:hypothetical protein
MTGCMIRLAGGGFGIIGLALNGGGSGPVCLGGAAAGSFTRGSGAGTFTGGPWPAAAAVTKFLGGAVAGPFTRGLGASAFIGGGPLSTPLM